MGDLSLYVSAAPEADAECELLGRLLAQLVPSIRWSIKRTPGPFEGQMLDMQALRESRFYVIILGMDIMAPMGTEWQQAKQAGMRIFCYRRINVSPTPAGAVFARDAGIAWLHYRSPEEFIGDLEGRLIQALLDGTPGYGLSADEIALLIQRQNALHEATEEPREDDASIVDDHYGAGGGGVILSANPRDV